MYIVYLYSCILVLLYYCILVYLYTCLLVYLLTCILVYMFTCFLVYLYACFLVYLYTRYRSCIYTRILDSRGLQCDALVLNQPLSPLSLVLKNWKRVSKKWDLGTFNSKGITCVWVPVNHICCCLVCLFVCWSYQIFWHAWILISSFWRNDCTKERPDLGVTCLLTIPKIPDVMFAGKRSSRRQRV